MKHPHYEVTKSNDQHQCDLLYVSHNIFKGYIYKRKLTGFMLNHGKRLLELLKPKGQVRLNLYSKQDIRHVFKYKKVIQYDITCEFKSDVTKFHEKQNNESGRTTTTHKHTHEAFMENFNKDLVKQLFKLMDVDEIQDVLKLLAIWVKNLYSIVNKMKNTHK